MAVEASRTYSDRMSPGPHQANATLSSLEPAIRRVLDIAGLQHERLWLAP